MSCDKLSSIFSTLLSCLIQLLRPFLGPDKICPFTIGCTQYAIMQLEQTPLRLAVPRICKRLILCNPITNIFKRKSPAT